LMMFLLRKLVLDKLKLSEALGEAECEIDESSLYSELLST